jgi:fumarate hydratase subunit alpha
MREIDVKDVTFAVVRLAQKTNFELGEDILAALNKASEQETSSIGREVIMRLLENAALAKTESLPLCQDCGSAVVFLDVGQDVSWEGSFMRP